MWLGDRYWNMGGKNSSFLRSKSREDIDSNLYVCLEMRKEEVNAILNNSIHGKGGGIRISRSSGLEPNLGEHKGVIQAHSVSDLSKLMVVTISKQVKRSVGISKTWLLEFNAT
jgi:hypothetical protein